MTQRRKSNSIMHNVGRDIGRVVKNVERGIAPLNIEKGFNNMEKVNDIMNNPQMLVGELMKNFDANVPKIQQIVAAQLKQWDLSDQEQQVILGTFVQKKSKDVLSGETGMSVANIESIQDKALAKIKKLLPSNYFGAGN